MDLLDLVILALRLVLVALLYAFLLVVMRSALRGLRAPATPPVRSATDRLRLQVVEPGAASVASGTILLVADGATLGRSPQADLVLADTTVSGEHARISRRGSGWSVTDLGSTNGTRVNDTRVSGSASLAPGDVLALGGVTLRVVAR